jgi:hypothetical protein
LLLITALFFTQVLQSRDWLSFILYLFLLPSLIWGPERSLYSAMFTLALALELYGTALGTWHWEPRLLGMGLPLDSANPPLASGTFYAVLDLLTLWAARALQDVRFDRRTARAGY